MAETLKVLVNACHGDHRPHRPIPQRRHHGTAFSGSPFLASAMPAAARICSTRRIHPRGICDDPLGQAANRFQEIPPQIRQRIFDLGWRDRRDGPRDEAILLKFPQCRCKHLLADLADFASQGIETQRPTAEHLHHEQGPLVADARKHPADVGAGCGMLLVIWFQQSASLSASGNLS